MKRITFHLGLLIVFSMVFVAACGQAPSGSGGGAVAGDLKVGVILPYTGIAAAAGKDIERGVQLAVDDVGGQIAGRKIVLMLEDETDDPNVSVTKARKLVEQDKVAVVLGPQLAHTSAAVSAYLAPSKTPNFVFGAGAAPTSEHTFYPGTGRGDAYPTGLFAAEDLKATKAAILFMDYLYGQQLRDGFKEAFTSKGGQVIAEKPIPFGTSDMAPFLEGLNDADLVALFLTAPADLAFAKQYRELGLTAPVLFISNAPQEEPLLAQMGEAAVGMYGSSYYSPELDTPENKQFVEKYQAKYQARPGIASQVAYLGTTMYLQAVKATNGDTSPDKITEALKAIKDLKHPGGTASMGAGRVTIHDQHIFQVAKSGDRFVWKPVKAYPAIEPR